MRTRYRETLGLIQHPVRQFTLSSWAVLARWGKGRQGLHVKGWLIETKAFAQELQGTSLAVQWLRLHLPLQGNAGLIPGEGIKIPHASQPENQNIKQKQYCNKFNKDFKNGPHHLKKKNLEKKKKKKNYSPQQPHKVRAGQTNTLLSTLDPLLCSAHYWPKPTRSQRTWGDHRCSPHRSASQGGRGMQHRVGSSEE